MSKEIITETVNWSEIRKKSGLTLSQASELTGFGVATINGLEKRGEGSQRLKDKLMAVLLSQAEEGHQSEARFWRDRAIASEQKLAMLKSAMEGWLKKI